jgi:hypothetical protein
MRRLWCCQWVSVLWALAWMSGWSLESVEAQPVDSGLSVPSSGESPLAVPAAGSLTSLPARDLAPGVLITIPPGQHAEDTAIGPMDLEFVAKHPELAWQAPDFEKNAPNFASSSETLLEMGRQVTFRHPVWALEFSFKPMRTIEADIPNKNGRMDRKLVWYLLYRLRYVGGDLLPDVREEEAGTGVANTPKQVVFKSVRFLPRFTFINTQTKVEKPSQILATVLPKIAQRERVGQPIYDEVRISREEIRPSVGEQDFPVWGVATWTDIAPETDFFIVQVRGLSNAYKVQLDAQGKSSYLRKTLQLQFWRPGDSIAQAEDQIRLGVPAFVDQAAQKYSLQQFGLEKRLAYLWLYR